MMKRTAVLAMALAAVGVLGGVTRAEDAKKKDQGGMVHVVIFTMKKDAPADAVESVVADCHKTLARISSVRGVKAGRPTKEATEPITRKDYDLALVILTDDVAGLRAYLEDPLHVEFVKKHGKHFDMKKLQVFDFVNEKK